MDAKKFQLFRKRQVAGPQAKNDPTTQLKRKPSKAKVVAGAAAAAPSKRGTKSRPARRRSGLKRDASTDADEYDENCETLGDESEEFENSGNEPSLEEPVREGGKEILKQTKAKLMS